MAEGLTEVTFLAFLALGTQKERSDQVRCVCMSGFKSLGIRVVPSNIFVILRLIHQQEGKWPCGRI